MAALFAAARQQRFVARFGARKMWLLLRQGHDLTRCTVERLMTANGWRWAVHAKKIKTTIAGKKPDRQRIWSIATSP